MKKVMIILTVAVFMLLLIGEGAQAATITLMSDASTLGAAVPTSIPGADFPGPPLTAADAAGLTFSPVILDSLGTNTPVPPGAPAGTQVINIPGGSYYKGESGFFEMTFTLPAGLSNLSLSGAGNVDDNGTVFLNGNAITSTDGLTEGGNATFSTANSSFFRVGLNTILISDENYGGYPSGGAFYANISYTAVPLPGAFWLLGSGLIGLVGLRRKLRTS